MYRIITIHFYSEEAKETHDRLYEGKSSNLNRWLSDSVDIADQNEFKSQSGWFTFSGMPQDKAALPYVLAKKCRLSYEQFMETKEAVYAFNFMQGEKVLESQYCSDLKALGEGGC